jgi:hypothetical protein
VHRVQFKKAINLPRYTETLSRSHGPIAAGTQKPANLSLNIDLEHKDATRVERSEPAGGTQPFYSEYAINPREVLRAEICSIKGALGCPAQPMEAHRFRQREANRLRL